MHLRTATLLAIVVGSPAAAQAPVRTPVRTEVPIREAVMARGVRRYAVTLTIDGRPVEAGLDTGSTGLRVLAAAVPDATSRTGERVTYSYNSGAQFVGPAVEVALGIGAVVGPKVRIARIDTVTCTARKPDCEAGKMAPADYRIMSDGVAGQGFSAILGIGLRDDRVPNPLRAMGVTRWIVELPRGGDTGPGRLILNPTDAEVSRYRQFAFVEGTNLVVGCIAAAAPGTAKICAPSMVDTGANGLQVMGGTPADLLPTGTPALIAIGDKTGEATMPVTIGRRDQAAAMRLAPARADGRQTLSLGIAPYLHWSILYDAAAHRIGVAERTNNQRSE